MFDQTNTTGVPPEYRPLLDPPAPPVTAEPVPSERVLELNAEPAANPKGTAMGWALTIAVAVVLTIVVKTFILQAYSIPSESMVPTLNVGDRVVVFRLNTDPARGDIVVFDRPANDPKTSPSDPDVLIKRVIGLPGDVVESRDGEVWVNGKQLVEDYLPDGTTTIIDTPITVPSGKLLVLGDNRSRSFDGRIFGPIDKDLVVGRAIARIWPLSRLGGL
ncbi:MAG TPA: signal peptidase I [Microthrixaceae bacterium]|jgi:signal peptidase I|nr:signal peptidase I [Microthrixaceae bacterium]HQF93897.1 signal peptidase I [Microthrixaceae bacterium]